MTTVMDPPKRPPTAETAEGLHRRSTAFDALRTQAPVAGADNPPVRKLRKCLSAPFGGCPVMTRISLAWAAGAVVWGTLTTFDNWLIRIGLVAGALVALGTIWQKFVKPVGRAALRIGAAVDAIFELAKDKQETDAWRRSVDEKLARLEDATEADLTVTHKVRQDHERDS